jgi:hypothetical protein
MSLDFSYRNVSPKHIDQFITDDKKFTALGETLPYVAMVVGLGKITPKNAAEFYARVAFYERLFGGFRMNSEHQRVIVLPREVAAAVGFYCNVADETWASFTKRILDQFRRDKLKQYDKERGA